ncbi:MAG: class I SAM-dependent methyltransferase [Planctomycetota bacterium]|nr:class I SAM-dependent methyltransferase [Planctomycetota bacterium]
MPETVEGNLYDFPKYYDLIFGSDWKAEYDFLLACFAKHIDRSVHRLFEPACGTGRLLVKLAQAGFAVSGNDLNPNAVKFCNARFQRHGLESAAVIGDMSNFRLRRKVDAAFNTINSFRHLGSEAAAVGHLECVARSLVKGGIYVLGLHLIPTDCNPTEDEAWSARRGNLQVNSYMWSKGIDKKARIEHLGMYFDVFTPTRQFRLVDHMEYRTYTKRQFQNLIRKVPELQIEETYDFTYRIDTPIVVDGSTEDVVFILKKS